MSDDKVIMWFAGIAITGLFILLRMQNAKINREVDAVTRSLHEISKALSEEKKQTVWRVDEIYKRIDTHNNELHGKIKASDHTTYTCRKEVDEKMERLMTETQVKDFVDRSLEPINKSLDSLNSNMEKMSESTSKILVKVESLAERAASSRKGD